MMERVFEFRIPYGDDPRAHNLFDQLPAGCTVIDAKRRFDFKGSPHSTVVCITVRMPGIERNGGGK